MTLFGLTQEDVTQLFLAIALLVNAGEAVYQRLIHKKVAETKTTVEEIKDESRL